MCSAGSCEAQTQGLLPPGNTKKIIGDDPQTKRFRDLGKNAYVDATLAAFHCKSDFSRCCDKVTQRD